MKEEEKEESIEIEEHPWRSFVPDGAKVVVLGTFPPPRNRWCMNFFYPNRTNDFWRIFGLLFLGDPNALYLPELKSFDVGRIQSLLTDKGIALAASTPKVRRLKGNASDKFLEIVERVDLEGLLAEMPHCRGIATTGEKAASVIAELTDTPLPKIGEPIRLDSGIEVWRLPSTSRAYPLALEKKAEAYARFFRSAGVELHSTYERISQ